MPKEAIDALTLLENWIDDPTDSRFEHIHELLFADTTSLDDVVWWALRVATASVGNKEAAWALSALCDHSASLGLSRDDIRSQGLTAVRARIT